MKYFEFDEQTMSCPDYNRHPEHMLNALVRMATVGTRLNPEEEQAMKINLHLLEWVEQATVVDRWKQIITGEHAEDVLRAYPEFVCTLIPEMSPCVGFDQRNPHHNEDVYNHIVTAVGYSDTDYETRMALLLHDIGKPDCFTVGEDGKGHFYGHMHRSAEIATDVLARFVMDEYDEAMNQVIVRLVENHELVHDPTMKSARKRVNSLVDPEHELPKLLDVMACDKMAHAPEHSDLYRVDSFSAMAYEIISERREQLKRQQDDSFEI